ncbi:hypothetical protein BH10BAC5_BH10BAC5_11640 [soil metagenome]
MKKIINIFILILLYGTIFSGCRSSDSVMEGKNIMLKNTKWEIISINKNPVESSRIYLIFNENGKVNGNAGCNTMEGSYTVEETRIKITDILSTKMYCSDMEKENMLLAALPEADTFYIKDSILTLLSSGKEVIKFKAASKN